MKFTFEFCIACPASQKFHFFTVKLKLNLQIICEYVYTRSETLFFSIYFDLTPLSFRFLRIFWNIALYNFQMEDMKILWSVES